MITRFTSPKVKEPAPKLWSNCIVCDGVAYISGLTSRGNDGVTINGLDEYEQSKIIFEKHKALIESAGQKCLTLPSLLFLLPASRIIKKSGRQELNFLREIFPPVL